MLRIITRGAVVSIYDSRTESKWTTVPMFMVIKEHVTQCNSVA